MAAKKLTDLALKNLKPKEKLYRVSDGTVGGLLVAVSTTGRKVFRLAFNFQGKAQLLTLGAYPEFFLTEAREMALAAKKQIALGKNPAATKQAKKAQTKIDTVTFRNLAAQWLQEGATVWSTVHIEDMEQKLNLHILPQFGDIPITHIGKAEIKAILDNLSAKGNFATLKKVRSILSQILRAAMSSDDYPGVTDWTALFRGKQYSGPRVQHRAAIASPAEIAGLMRAIKGYAETSPITAFALLFSALTFCRPGEIRHAEWCEIDYENTLWRLPAEKIKMREPHLVPLATQTLELLQQLHPFTCKSKYLFPSTRSINRPMSEATITAALRRMGYGKEEMCAHGFRGMASTRLNELGFRSDWIEKQLAHSEKDKIRGAYKHADFLAGRRQMMQDWANYLTI